MIRGMPAKPLTRFSPIIAVPAGVAIGAAAMVVSHDRMEATVPPVPPDAMRPVFVDAGVGKNGSEAVAFTLADAGGLALPATSAPVTR